MQLSSDLQKKLSYPSNPKKYVTSWNIELFIGSKSSVAAQKKEQEFYAAAQRRLSRGNGTEGRPLCSCRTLRNHRENILGYSSLLLTAFLL